MDPVSDNGEEGSVSDRVTLNYTFSSGNNLIELAQFITTPDSPDRPLVDSSLRLENETGVSREPEWGYGLAEDVWFLEEPFGPGETLRIQATYAVPAASGAYEFEVREKIAGEWNPRVRW